MPKEKIPSLQMRAQFIPGTYNSEARTIDICWTTGYKGLRWGWDGNYYEELEVSDKAVRLDRLNNGAPFLLVHNSYDARAVIGVVDRAWIENGKGYATIRFTERAEVQDIIKDITDGILRNISVGYQVYTYERIESADDKVPTYRGIDWEPYELSSVPVGFDPGAQTRSKDNPDLFEVEIITRSAPPAVPGGQQQKEEFMPDPITQRNGVPETVPPVTAVRTEQTPTNAPPTTDQIRAEAAGAERKRCTQIRNQVRIAQLADSMADDLIARGVSFEDACEEITRAWTEKGSKAPTTSGVSVTRDENETTRRGMESAILLRVAPSAKLKPEEVEMARNYRGLSLREMARESLEAAGINTRSMSALELAGAALSQRMHTTSDFPLILANVANRRLRSAYEDAPATYQVWARRAPNAPDFKAMTILQLGAGPNLEQIPEGAEYTLGTMAEGKETYSMVTYGKMIAFSRQMLINDDLRAFDRATSAFAAAARRLENQLVYAQITGNPKMSDGTDLFHADHGNLVAKAAISVNSLGAARSAMRIQKGIGGELLNIVPRFLIVPAAMEQLAYQYTSSQFVPSQASNINEFRAGGRTALETVVDPLLDATSTEQWYAAADSNQIDTVEYCYLDGAEGVYLESELGFDVDGLKLKARLDFASKAIDHRGMYRNG